MVKTLMRGLALGFFLFPEPIITNAIGVLLLATSFTPGLGCRQYWATCGCEFHRTGRTVLGLWSNLVAENKNMKLVAVPAGRWSIPPWPPKKVVGHEIVSFQNSRNLKRR